MRGNLALLVCEPMNDTLQSNESGMWYVQFASDVVRVMTLEQLDAAFQSGVISEETYVRQDGVSEWSRLAQIAGIEPDRTPSAASYAVESSALGPESIRPVVSELNDVDPQSVDDVPVEFRSRKRGVVLALAAVMLIGGIGFGATKLSLASVNAAPVAAAQPAPPSPIAALPSNLTAAISEAHLGEQALPKELKLTGAQKKVLLDADKKRDQLRDEKKARSPKTKKRSTSAPVFHTGGNVHDPLNSSISAPAR